MTDLNALADRIEAAERPSRKLDAEILAFTESLKAERDMRWPEGAPPMRYTASLDAAMTLVPEDFDWRIGRTNGGLTIFAEVGGVDSEFIRFGSTPALALCAGALRAQAIEARRAETGTGSVNESAVGSADAPQGGQHDPSL